MAKDVYLQGATYSDVPSVELPCYIDLIPSGTVRTNMMTGSQYYGTIQGSADYVHDEVKATFDGTTYTLPYDPDPNGYAEGYRGYGANFTSSTNLDFSTYPLRVEDDDNQGGWRIYTSSNTTHSIKVSALETGYFYDVSDTTAVENKVANGFDFYLADGTKATGTLNIGSTTLIAGTIRPDAELVSTYSYDQYIVADEGVTLPSYSTSAQTLKSTSNLGTVTLDYTNYDYQVLYRFLAIPKYTDGTEIAIGREEYWFGTYLYDNIVFPTGTLKTLDGTKTYNARLSSMHASGIYYREVYWASATTITQYSTASYGTYMGVTTSAISGTSMTVKAPTLMIRGHTTYFREARWNEMEDIRYQYKIYVYRAPKGNLNLDGWGTRQLTEMTINDINNGGTLTT